MGRSSALQPTRRGRVLFGTLLVGFTMLAVFGMVVQDWSLLRMLNVPVMDQTWMDARTISGAGEALQRGLNPFVENPGDPAGRPLNYPRVWLLFAWLGGGAQHTWLLAWFFFLSLVFALATLVPLARSTRVGVVLALGVFAPTTWLAIERSNSDLWMFALCALAAWQATARPIAATAVVQCAALLKLFPAAAIAGLLGEDALRRRLVIGTVAVFAAYVVVSLGDIRYMYAGTARAEWLAYGVATLPALLAKNAPVSNAIALGASVALLAIAAGYAYRQRLHGRLGCVGTPHSMAAFRIGAAVYLGSFLIGHSFDYRLIFLLLTLPQLATWSSRGPAALRRSAGLQLAGVLFLQWSLTWRGGLEYALGDSRPGFLIDEALSWATWLGLALFFAQTLPEWLVPAGCRQRPFHDQPAAQEPAAEGPAAPIPAMIQTPPTRKRVPGA